MKKSYALGLAVAVAMGVSLIAAAPAQAAAPGVQVTKVYYNSPGSDTGSKKSLNAEYVRITNKRKVSMNLKNWTLRDKTGYVYKFTTSFTVKPGKSVYIHTGKGSNTGTHRYWGRSWYVWNNTGDKAYLRNSVGRLVDSCSWGRRGSYTFC